MRNDLTNREFGRLRVIRYAGFRKKRSYWTCQCSCGAIKDIRGDALLKDMTVSCGCYSRDQSKARTKHGCARNDATTTEYNAWHQMIQRCVNPSNRRFKYYGARGIKVCERWRLSFKAFLDDLGLRPTPEHSLGRKDNDGDYEPGNCEWQTEPQQRRNTSYSHYLEHDGKRLTVAEWARETGLNVHTLHYRLRAGWTTTDTLTTPPGTAKGGR